MRSRHHALMALALAAAALLPARAAADQHTLTKTFPFRSGDRLEVDTDTGSIEVRTGTADEIRLTVRSKEQDLAGALDLTFATDRGLRVEARTLRHGRKPGWFSGWFGRNDSSHIEFLIDAPSRMDLALKTSGGHITVGDVEGEVALATRGGHVQFGAIDGPLHVETSGGHIRGERASGPAELETAGGHIRVDRADSDLDVQTAGGHITVGDVGGALRARTAGGHIQTGRVGGDMELRTAGGNLTSKGCGGKIVARTSGGRIDLESVAGYVEARTAGGDLRVSLLAGNTAGGDLESHGSGDIEVILPDGIGLQVEAQAGSTGTVEVDSAMHFEGSLANNRLRGTLNGGGSLLRLQADGGDIRLLTSLQ
ncbi:MAG: DUF4097 domain-containing protein [Acidobacteriota bacterium]